MGYLHKLEANKCFLGDDVPNAYHSIDQVLPISDILLVTVNVYYSRDAKHLNRIDSQFVERTPVYFPKNPVTSPLLGTYSLSVPLNNFNGEWNKTDLYAIVKRLLGHTCSTDVFDDVITDVEMEILEDNDGWSRGEEGEG